MGDYYFEVIRYFGERENWVQIPALPLRRQVVLVLLLKALYLGFVTSKKKMFGDYCKREKTTEAKLQTKHRHPMYETNIKLKTLLEKWGSLPELSKHGLQPLNLLCQCRHGTMLPWA